MKKTKYFLCAIFTLGLIVACVDNAEVYRFPKEKYYYDIPDVPVTEDYVVGVQYETRDSGYWFNNTTVLPELYTGTPKLGEYTVRAANSRELTPVLEQHLKWGKEAGIDFFFLSWGGFGWNDTLIMKWGELWEQDHAYPKLVIRFDPGYMYNKGKLAEVPGTNDTLQRDQLRMDTLRHQFDSLYTTVISKPFVYRNKSDQPVMMLGNFKDRYPAELIDLKAFVNEFRTVAGNKLWILGDLGGNWTSPEMWGYRDETTFGTVKADTISAFDGVFINDLQTGSYERYAGYFSFLDFNYNYWQTRMRPLNKEYIPSIIPSFDNRVRDISSGDFLFPRWSLDGKPYLISAKQNFETGVTLEEKKYNFSNYEKNPYQSYANVAKRNVGASRIILIYSWNNFRSGTNLEPTEEINTDYLLYTKQLFKK